MKPRSKANKVAFRRVKAYCDSMTGHKIGLTIALGYSTTKTIDKWLDNGWVPENRVKSIIEFFAKEEL